jgi:hypothetical protein
MGGDHSINFGGRTAGIWSRSIPAGALVNQTTERYLGSEQEVAIAVIDNVSVNSGLTDDEPLPLCKEDVGCDLVKSVGGDNALDICGSSRLSAYRPLVRNVH